MDNDYATYNDVYGPGGMADDSDDSGYAEYLDPNGYCEHGHYVGGSGPDYMCGWCESGISVAEMRQIINRQRLTGIRKRADGAAKLLNVLLMHGMGGMDAAYFAQQSSYVGNPHSRYGRH